MLHCAAMRIAFGLLAAWLGLAGCSIEPPVGVFGCSEKLACPRDQVCGSDSRCHASDWVADGGTGDVVVTPREGGAGGDGSRGLGGHAGEEPENPDDGSCIEPCDDDRVCSNGACVRCRPGQRDCDGNRVRVCSDEGSWSEAESCGSERPICNGGKCVGMRVTGHLTGAGPGQPVGQTFRLIAQSLSEGARACGEPSDKRICVRGGIAP